MMDDRGDKQAMCCWFLASVFSAGSQKFGPTHIIRWINIVPPGFVRLPVVALIPTDGRHNWEQSSKGQLVVSCRLHPGNPPCTAVTRSFTLLQKPFHPSASLLAFPDIPCNRTYPLSSVCPFRLSTETQISLQNWPHQSLDQA